MKTFLIGTAKITIGLILASAMIGGGVAFYDDYSWNREREHEKQEKNATQAALGPKEWPPINRPDVGLRFELVTKWVEGCAQYQFRMIGKQSQPLENLTVVMKDKDGFLIYGKKFSGELFMDYPGGGLPPVGIQSEGAFKESEMTQERYLRVGQWEVMWKADFESAKIFGEATE